jgi:hypothetical protein
MIKPNRKWLLAVTPFVLLALLLSPLRLPSDEATMPVRKQRITSATRVGTEWWYEGLPPEWYQGEVDPDRDLPESLSALASVPDMVQQSLSGKKPVLMRGY